MPRWTRADGGPGERLVFEPYTKEVFKAFFRGVAERGIFPEGQIGAGIYETSVIPIGAE